MSPDQPGSYRLVDQPEQLVEVCADLSGTDPLVLDTEFHSERRFLPELMLLQIGRPGGVVWMIDPRTVSLAPLGPVLAGREWWVHGGSFDLSLLHLHTGALPSEVLDTQILAAMQGLPHPLRLDRLAKRVLDLRVDKGGALSDWAARPLDRAQLRYAAGDVLVTGELVVALLARLDPLRQGWAREAGQELLTAALAPPDPDQELMKWDIAGELDPRTLQILRALYRWRLREAVSRDQPPFYLLSDGVALDLARRRPQTTTEIRANRRIPDGLVKRHGGALLTVIAGALASDEPLPAVPDHLALRRLRLLASWADAMEEILGIAGSLLLPLPLARAVAIEGPSSLAGWRHQAAGEHLALLWNGERGIFFTQQNQSVIVKSPH